MTTPLDLPALRAELATHNGRDCGCPHKVACEDREQWLLAQIAKAGPKPDPAPPMSAANIPALRAVIAGVHQKSLKLDGYGFECEGGPLTHCRDWTELRSDLTTLANACETLAREVEALRAENERLRVSNGHLANQIRADRERYDRDISAPAGKGVRGE